MEIQHTPDPVRDIELQLESDGRSGLYPLLTAARGALVAGRFRVGDLFAAGRQVFVFDATDEETGDAVVLKQAAFDYRDPLRYSRREAAALRAPLVFEYEVQRICATGHMSRPLALLRAPAIVPEARDSAVLGREEVFAIQEKLEALPLALVALQSWPQRSQAAREQAAAHMAADFVRFWEDLRVRGWIYTDVNANNLLLGPDDRLWVVDAAGAVPTDDEILSPGMAPGFATPHLWARFLSGQALRGDLSLVLPPLAKVLHFGLTRLTPLNGLLPDLGALRDYSPGCQRALAAMLDLDKDPAALPAALQCLDAWAVKARDPRSPSRAVRDGG